jgi:hypothetical protein
MSTHWYAARVAHLHSIEDDPEWFRRIAIGLPENVRYELREGSEYWKLDDYSAESVDFVVVDGSARDECVRAAVPKVRRGGWLYLDNSDKDMTVPDGPVRRAEALLRAAVNERGGHIEQRTGLAIGLLVANEWTLCQL